MKEFTLEDFDRALREQDYKTLYAICSNVDAYSWRPDLTLNKHFSISTMEDGWYEAATLEDYRRVREYILRLRDGKVKVYD